MSAHQENLLSVDSVISGWSRSAQRMPAFSDPAGSADALSRGARGGDEQTTPALPAAATYDVIAALTWLAALRDAGILTDDEFSAEKAKILGRS